MTRIVITIPGAPTPKGRPRFSRRSGRAFTPAATERAESTLAGRAMAELQPWRAQLPLSGALRLEACFTMPVPASWSKVKRAAAMRGEVQPTGRPDLDNILKLATDALNGVVWTDDAQIVEIVTRKQYGEVPSTHLVVVAA